MRPIGARADALLRPYFFFHVGWIYESFQLEIAYLVLPVQYNVFFLLSFILCYVQRIMYALVYNSTRATVRDRFF